jgi:hypothetical protein
MLTTVTRYAVPTVDIKIHLHHLTLANAAIALGINLDQGLRTVHP